MVTMLPPVGAGRRAAGVATGDRSLANAPANDQQKGSAKELRHGQESGTVAQFLAVPQRSGLSSADLFTGASARMWTSPKRIELWARSRAHESAIYQTILQSELSAFLRSTFAVCGDMHS
jgi:hypothetical protein